jgi:hypothetical protein
MLRGWIILRRYISWDDLLRAYVLVVLGVTGTEGQETERFLGARKSARLLVGWEDSIVSLWASEKK